MMQTSPWLGLVRLLPPSIHNSLVLVTRIGQEFTVQDIFRIEENYLVVRGRLGGTTDAGRVIVIPYSEIHYLGFQKSMKAADISAIFGGEPLVAESEKQEVVAAADSTPEPEPPPAVVEQAPEPEPSVPVPAEPKPSTPNKSLLLQRVRARLAASAQAKAAGPSQ
jgi:hypothetical protein